jgi:large subunit ribosomal protein L24
VQTSLLGLAIALILALLTALLGPFFIDWNQYRPAFEAQASRLVGLPVRVKGDIDARLLPTPSLLLSGIEIGAAASGQPLRAKALGIELALGGLLRGQVRANEMRLLAPDVAIALDNEGRLSVPNAALGFNLSDVSIAKLAIEDARVALSDAASGSRIVFEKLWFTGDVRSLAGVFRGEGAFVLGGSLYGYRIATSRADDGELRLKFGFEPSERPLSGEGEGVLSFAQGEPRFEGGLTLSRAAGTALSDGRAVMHETWRATARVVATPASALFEQVEFQHGPDERALKMTGTADMTFGAEPRTQAVVSARQIDLDRAFAASEEPRRDPLSVVKAMAASFADFWPRAMPLQIGFGIDGVTLAGGNLQTLRGDLALTRQGWSLNGVEFRAPGFTQIQMSGDVSASAVGVAFAGPVEISALDARVFMAWLGGQTDTPAGPATPLRGRGDVTIDDKALAVERLTFEIDRKPVTGRVIYVYPAGETRARLEAELKAAELDVDAALALVTTASSHARIARPAEIALALDVARARFVGLDVRQAHVKAAFDAAGIRIERLDIGDFGGMRIAGQGLIDTASAGPRGNMALQIDARDLGGLSALAATYAPKWSETLRDIPARIGKANLRAVLNVAPQEGHTQAQLDLSGLLGDVRVDIKAGATGTLAEPRKADLQIEGVLAGENAGALLRLTGLERIVTASRGPGRLTLSAKGPVDAQMNVGAALAASDLEARASGTLRPLSDGGPSGAFDLSVSRADAAPLLRATRPVPLALNARAALSGDTLKLAPLTMRVDGAPLRGRLDVAFGNALGVDGDIEADAVNGAALLAAVAGQRDGAALASEEPFAAGLALPARGRVGFRAKAVALSATSALSDVRGKLDFTPDGVAATIEKAAFASGGLSGAVSVRRMPEARAAKLRLALKGADADAVIPGRTRPAMAGRLDLDFEMEGSGRSPKALLGSLSGAGTLSLSEARIAGLDPEAFAAAMRAVDQGLPLDGVRVRDFAAAALDKGALRLRAVEMPFTVAAGQVRFATLQTQGEGADAAMSGAIDLQRQTLDARILLTGAAGGVAASAGRPEISLQLKGPLNTPARSLDVAAFTGWLALRAVEQQAKKLEAIERNPAPVTSSVPPEAAAPSSSSLPERSPVLPRVRPTAETAPSTAPRAPAVVPLPPPIDIRPVPGSAPRGSGL